MIWKLIAAFLVALRGSGTRSASSGGPFIHGASPPSRPSGEKIWVPATRMKNGRIRKGYYRRR